jgi:serine/threonine protein kinase
MTPELSDVIAHTGTIELGKVSTNQTSSTQSQHQRRPTSQIMEDPSAKYKLLEQVGNGSFGVVYKAVNKDTGEVVAIKEVCRLFD